ncbi:MAG: prolipoprotein diacylglyceryl transferase [Chloroflexi bacterium]|nr:prolipoprotein diacylglyceryl transferase [Chloroflexota bacterium]
MRAPDPRLFSIGPFTVYWYGVLIVTGATLAAYITSRLSRRNGHNPDIAWNLLIVLLVTGIIGARLYHVVDKWEYYRQNPGQIIGLQMQGFGIYGAVAGGALGLWAYCRQAKLRFLEWADYTAPGLLLAQSIGRWGNFFNQELYGFPTDLPWGVYIAPEHRLEQFATYERFHPTFLYESVLCFIGFAILLYLARNWRKNRMYGDIFFLYFVIYPIVRFFTEFQRPDAWIILGMPTAQWISIICVLIFTSLLIVRRKLRRPSMIYTPGEPWQPAEAAEDSAPDEHNDDKPA